LNIYNEKQLEIKKQHHYVWADYMRYWSLNKRDVYYTKKRGGIALDSVKSIAVERSFYKVRKLSSEHIDLIRGFIFMSNNKELIDHHLKSLKYYLEMQQLYELSINSEVKSEDANLTFEAFINNSVENQHFELERDSQPIAIELRKLNTTVLKDKEKMTDFLFFLGNQITRTKAFKDTFINSLSMSPEKNQGHLVDDCWWFLSLVFGCNISEKLCNDFERYHHTILVNETETPFITSDQPVTNIYPNLTYKQPPRNNETDYFYPLSPTKAYLISKSGRFKSGISFVDEVFVEQVNKEVSMGAYYHIISNNKESLKPYQKLVGKRIKLG
tara:strand:+ start:8698 stop:9681 length:984 start_codon:yes stop_codon:yes gene_type:complete